MIINAYGEYDFISEGEMEALDNVAMRCQVKEVEDGQVSWQWFDPGSRGLQDIGTSTNKWR